MKKLLLILSLLILPSYLLATCIITSNDNVFDNGFSTPLDAWQDLGNSFTACQDGAISKVKVLSVDARSNISMEIYEGNGVSGSLLATVTGISLHTAGTITDYSEIDVSGYNISVTNGSQYTFYFIDYVRIYFNDDQNMYSGGTYWVYDQGSPREMVLRDMYFEIEIGDASLPVELSSFSARSEGQTVVLEWVTESEKDNLGFVLERSQDKTSWAVIASYQTCSDLVGQGNTASRTEYTFTDKTAAAEADYTYRLSDVNIEGNRNVIASTSVHIDALPTATHLFAAYPNPFNPTTTVRYQLAKETDVKISVYNTLGSHIKTLFRSHQLEGSYQASWNGTDENGSKVPSGAYLIRMQTDKVTQTHKVLLVK